MGKKSNTTFVVEKKKSKKLKQINFTNNRSTNNVEINNDDVVTDINSVTPILVIPDTNDKAVKMSKVSKVSTISKIVTPEWLEEQLLVKGLSVMDIALSINMLPKNLITMIKKDVNLSLIYKNIKFKKLENQKKLKQSLKQTKEQENKIRLKKLIDEGMSINDISKYTGSHYSVVYSNIKKYGLSTTNNKAFLIFNKVTPKQLLQWYEEGKNNIEVASLLNMDEKSFVDTMKLINFYQYIDKSDLQRWFNQGRTRHWITNTLHSNYETLNRYLNSPKIKLLDEFYVQYKNRLKDKKYIKSKDQFLNLLNKKMTNQEIMTELDIDQDLFQSYVKKYQLKRIIETIDKEKNDLILIDFIKSKLNDLEDNWNIHKIADLINKPVHRVGYFMRKYNIVIPTHNND